MTWQKQSEEASIVLVGDFNPAIYHPEWFIGKEILQSWDYDENAVTIIKDFSEIKLQGGSILNVILNQFILKSSQAGAHLALKDLVISTFSILSETPIRQMGLNYTMIVKMANKDDWMKFGRTLAPKQTWAVAVGYLTELPIEKQLEFGLWDINMHLPRPDDLLGFIQVRIKVVDQKQHKLSISVNDHYEIEEQLANYMVTILNDNWETSQARSKGIVESLLQTALQANP